MEKFIVRNNSGTMLNLSKNGIMLKPNQDVDLVHRTNKRLIDLENDPEILREIGFNNLIIMEKYDSRNNDLSEKMDKIIKTLEPKPVIEEKIEKIDLSEMENIVAKCLKRFFKTGKMVIGETSEKEEIVKKSYKKNNDEELRQKAIEQLLSRSVPIETNLKPAQERQIEGQEDFSDMIDF